MSESLFTSQTPSSANNSDGGAAGITTGTKMTFAVNGTVSGVRFYATSTVGGTYTVGAWSVTDQTNGTLLASKTAGAAPTAGTWNVVSFDSPVSVTAGTPYLFGVWNSDGRYASTANFFGSALTNGNITGIADGSTIPPAGTLRNGNFLANAAFAYPSDFFNANCYFVDVVFDASSGVVDGDAALATTTTLTAAAAVDHATTATLATTVTLTAAGQTQPSSGAALATTFTGAAAATVTHDATANLGLTFTGTAAPEQAPVVSSGPGWASLYGVLAGQRADDLWYQERLRNPVECPVHFYPLDTNAAGELHCTFGGHIVTKG